MIEYMKGLGDNDKMSLVCLTQKLAMLMTLTSASRGSELRALDPTLMSDKGSVVVFHIAELTKTKRPSKPKHTVVFEKFEDDSSLDVIEALRTYSGVERVV